MRANRSHGVGLRVDPIRQASAKSTISDNFWEIFGAQERTRTSTPVRALAPEASASTSSATWAGVVSAGNTPRRGGCQRPVLRRSGGLFRACGGSNQGRPAREWPHVETRDDLRRLRLLGPLHRPAHGQAGLAGPGGGATAARGAFRADLRRGGAG